MNELTPLGGDSRSVLSDTALTGFGMHSYIGLGSVAASAATATATTSPVATLDPRPCSCQNLWTSMSALRTRFALSKPLLMDWI